VGFEDRWFVIGLTFNLIYYNRKTGRFIGFVIQGVESFFDNFGEIEK